MRNNIENEAGLERPWVPLSRWRALRSLTPPYAALQRLTPPGACTPCGVP